MRELQVVIRRFISIYLNGQWNQQAIFELLFTQNATMYKYAFSHQQMIYFVNIIVIVLIVNNNRVVE